MIKIGIIGGTGYTGVELLRLLVQHPDVELKVITSRGEAGKPVAEMFPNLWAKWTSPSASLTRRCWRPDRDGIAECCYYKKHE